MTPAFLVPAALAIVGFIVWLVRLEAKLSAQAAAVAKLDKEIEKLKLELEVHRANQDIHFNARIAEEVDKRNEQRFKSIESGIVDIQRKLNHLAGRE